MAIMKKIMIAPYFGPLPAWFEKFRLPKGYDLLLDTDSEAFKKRVKEKLGIDCPITPGTGKSNDLRCAFGLLYEEEIKNYDYWGTVDFDMVFSDNIDEWFPDEVLITLDVWSNHNTYVCGPWTMFRNNHQVCHLFKEFSEWKEKMTDPVLNGWIEKEYSRVVEQSGIKYKYSFHQGYPWTKTPNIEKRDGILYQDRIGIPMFHFRHSKKFPL